MASATYAAYLAADDAYAENTVSHRHGYAAYAAAAASAAAAACASADGDAADAAAAAADTAAEAAAFADDGAAADVWTAITVDCQWLVTYAFPEKAPARLTALPLWLYNPDSDETLAWQTTTERLIRFASHWQVWIDWYDRRLQGQDAAFDIPGDSDRTEDKALLIRLADATNADFWSKGADYVNTQLQRWLDEARARASRNLFDVLPTQDPQATAYGVNEEGRVDRLPPIDQQHLRDVQDQRRAYADIRAEVLVLLEEGQRLGSRLSRALNRLLASMPERFEDAEAYPVWRDGIRLRRIYLAHQQVATREEPDEAKLEPMIAEDLGGLLDLYNNFTFDDDGLRARDEKTVPAQERVDASKEAAIGNAVDAAIKQAPDIATPQALDDIAALGEDTATATDDPYTDQILVESNRLRRNWIAGLLAGARPLLKWTKEQVSKSGGKYRDGFVNAAGSSTFVALVAFIINNAPILKAHAATAFQSSGALALIDAIVRAFS